MRAHVLLATAAVLLTAGCQGSPSTTGRAGATTDTELLARGARVYHAYCAACHGDSGHGEGWEHVNLKVTPPDLSLMRIASDPTTVAHLVQHAQTTAPITGVPVKPGVLEEFDIRAVIAYLDAGMTVAPANDLMP